MREYLVVDFDNGTVVTLSFATASAQIDQIFHLVFGNEFFDNLKVSVIAATETGTPHANNDLLFHKKFSSTLNKNWTFCINGQVMKNFLKCYIKAVDACGQEPFSYVPYPENQKTCCRHMEDA
jgi:hypothetical protein